MTWLLEAVIHTLYWFGMVMLFSLLGTLLVLACLHLYRTLVWRARVRRWVRMERILARDRTRWAGHVPTDSWERHLIASERARQ